MPKVNGKEFPYSAAGRKAAADERAKSMNKGMLPGLEKRPKPKGK